MDDMHTSPAPQQHEGITLRQLWAMLMPWRWWLTLAGVAVLLGAVLELVPPLLMQQIVDEHLALGRSDGLLWIAALYLSATAAVQGMGFLTEYGTAIISQATMIAPRWGRQSAAARRMSKPCRRSSPQQRSAEQWLPREASPVGRAGPPS
jgi:hypothetical protein